MNTIIWSVVGLLAGGVAVLLLGAQGFVHRVETVAVAIFGAFIGGDFVAAQLSGAPAGSGFRISSLALALAGSIVMLLLLRLMRRTVGPLRPHKATRKPRS